MSPKFMIAWIIIVVTMAQTVCKGEPNSDVVATSHSFNLNDNKDKNSYLLDAVEYKSGNIDMSLINQWFDKQYEAHISSDDYNQHQLSPIMHEIKSSKEFMHFIDISIDPTFKQTYYEIIDENVEGKENQIVLRIFCKECVMKYDIHIPFMLKSMNLDDTISLVQHLSAGFKQHKQQCDIKINELNTKIISLENELKKLHTYIDNKIKSMQIKIDEINKYNKNTQFKILTDSQQCTGEDIKSGTRRRPRNVVCTAKCEQGFSAISGRCEGVTTGRTGGGKDGEGWMCAEKGRKDCSKEKPCVVHGYVDCLKVVRK